MTRYSEARKEWRTEERKKGKECKEREEEMELNESRQVMSGDGRSERKITGTKKE